MWDIITAHKQLTGFLEKKGVESPRLVSEILLSHTLGVSRVDIYSRFDLPITEEQLKTVNPLAKRVAAGDPLQLVVGTAQFLSYTLHVERGVFIPRPETEGLVDGAARRIRSRIDTSPGGKTINIFEIGLGTGAISISLLKLLPSSTAAGSDINPAAVELSMKNAASLGVEERFTAIHGPLFSCDTQGAPQEFDLVISNPPYIPSGDIATLDPVVRDHDPREALDGGADGLDVVKEIIRLAPAHLAKGGLLALEVGAGQARETASLAAAAGFAEIEIEKDLQGIERCVFAWKP